MSADTVVLRRQIRDLVSLLDGLGPEPDSMPQFSISTNAVRHNEYLAKRDTIQSDLIRTYARYAESLEEISTGLVETQRQMVKLLRFQAEHTQH